MIDYKDCEKDKLIEVVESLAYKVLQYQHPEWYDVSEEEILSLLKQEDLPIRIGE